MPYEADSNPSRTLLPFMQEFDGGQPDISEDERLQVRQAFESLISDVFEAHSEAVDATTLPGETHLYRETPEYGIGEGWSLNIRQRDARKPAHPIGALITFPPEETILAQITIHKNQGRKARERSTYRLGGDGVVRRLDEVNLSEQAQLRRPSESERRTIGGILPPTQEDIEAIADPQRIPDAMRPEELRVRDNMQTEQDMRLNNFPVSADEIQGLKDWLQSQPFEGLHLRPYPG